MQVEKIPSKIRSYVRAIIIKDDCILLLKENKNNNVLWNFPGGKVENLESAELAIYREIEEELGVKCQSCKLFFVGKFTFEKQVWRGWYFKCELSKWNFTFESTTEEAKFFKISEIDSIKHGIPTQILERISN